MVLGRIHLSHLLRNVCLLRRMLDLLAVVDLAPWALCLELWLGTMWHWVKVLKCYWEEQLRHLTTSGSSFLQFMKVLVISTSGMRTWDSERHWGTWIHSSTFRKRKIQRKVFHTFWTQRMSGSSKFESKCVVIGHKCEPPRYIPSHTAPSG